MANKDAHVTILRIRINNMDDKNTNSCFDCVACSDDDRCNGYLDLKCNIGYRLGWDRVPFMKRYKECKGKSISVTREIENKYPCRFHTSFADYIANKQ